MDSVTWVGGDSLRDGCQATLTERSRFEKYTEQNDTLQPSNTVHNSARLAATP